MTIASRGNTPRKIKILVLSAYDAHSHKVWRSNLSLVLPQVEFTHVVLPARHFAWRIRGNPLSWYQQPELQCADYDACIATSMVDVASLRGMSLPALQCPIAVYFHENQFAYPSSRHQKFSDDPKVVQLYAALAGDIVCFNSRYNQESFLQGAEKWMRLMPDHVNPEKICHAISRKTRVLPVPLQIGAEPPSAPRSPGPPYHIAWNHRWEYDKGPHRLLAMLETLPADSSVIFHIIGQSFRRIPEDMQAVHALLKERKWLGEWGYQESPRKYFEVLQEAHFVLSTSEHDFQGLAVLEAVAAGCVPILPERLVYPEIFDHQYLYPSHSDVDVESKALADHIAKCVANPPHSLPNVRAFGVGSLVNAYADLLEDLLSIRQA